jgi:hypothetical protein
VSESPWIPGVGDVASLARSHDTTILITVAPLNVNSPEVRRTGFGRRFDQHEIDRAYLEERERSTEFTSVRWLPPVTARGPDNEEQVMIPLEALTGLARDGERGVTAVSHRRRTPSFGHASPARLASM